MLRPEDVGAISVWTPGIQPFTVLGTLDSFADTLANTKREALLSIVEEVLGKQRRKIRVRIAIAVLHLRDQRRQLRKQNHRY